MTQKHCSNPRLIADAIASVQGFQAVTGEISFNEHRNPGTKAIVMLEIKDGKLSVRDRVAPPKASAPMAVSAAASAPMSAASAPAK